MLQHLASIVFMTYSYIGPQKPVVVGRCLGPFGIQGWFKVYSYTDPLDNILNYSPWFLQDKNQCWSEVLIEQHKCLDKGLIVRLNGCHDRTQASIYRGCTIAINETQLLDLPPGEYYWKDLVGLQVYTLEGVYLGVVTRLFATGANDVMVVELLLNEKELDGFTEVEGRRKKCVGSLRSDQKNAQSRLIPYHDTVVKLVDLAQGRMQVLWDPEF